MEQGSAVLLGVAGLVMVIAAFLLGRRTGGGVTRQLELEAELATAHSQKAQLEAEAERLKNDIDAARQEYDEYRLNVVDHFSGTSDVLRELTVQYQNVYEHLTRGASMLCPEGFVGLTEGLPVPQLADPKPDLEVAGDDLPNADAAGDPSTEAAGPETAATDDPTEPEELAARDSSEDTLLVPPVS